MGSNPRPMAHKTIGLTTELHSTTHKYPVINILRQVLKTCGYNLNPKRVSNGYTKAGVKLYKRSFVIKQTSNLMQL